MSVRCSVLGCISRKEEGNGINFFRFPLKPQQRERWLKILNIPLLESPNNSYVCSKHFEQKYFVTNNGNKLLLPGAIPAKKRTYTRNSCNLVPIQPKPNSIQNILIKPLPIVVVPLQNNLTIPNTFNLSLEPQTNQNFSNLQTIQTQVVEINDQNENNGFSTVPISEKTVEVSIFNEEQNSISDETESVISVNSDNETTQNSTKQDESCYVLVEVNDKFDDSLNSQDDANIVASGFDIKELINDAKIAMNKRLKNIPTPSKNRKVRSWRTNNIGDCVFEDMENPVIRRHHWTLALNEIHKLRRKVKALEQKTRRLQKRLDSSKLRTIQSQQNQEDCDNVEENDDNHENDEENDDYYVQIESDDD